MSIVYIHQHFCTNAGSGGTRSYDVARHLIAAGHRVHMIAGIYDRSGLEPMPWYRLFRHENIDEIDLTVCNVMSSNKYTAIKRIAGYCWFAVLASWAALRDKRPDVVFATSTPLTVGIPGFVAGLLRRAPFLLEIRDIWPEAFVHAGFVKGDEPFIKAMGWLERFLYGRAQKILLVSPDYQTRLIERGFPAEKMITIALGADGAIFSDVQADHSFVERYGLAGKTIAIFTGAHGKANGLDYVLAAAECSRNRNDIAFVLIGDGHEKLRLIEEAKGKGLTNVVFADAVPKERLPGILAVSHIGLMILSHIGDRRPELPNKLYDYMFAGVPSLVNFKGPALETVEADGSGLYVDPTRPEDLAQKVALLADDVELRQQMSARGRAAGFAKYERRIIARQLEDAFAAASAHA